MLAGSFVRSYQVLIQLRPSILLVTRKLLFAGLGIVQVRPGYKHARLEKRVRDTNKMTILQNQFPDRHLQPGLSKNRIPMLSVNTPQLEITTKGSNLYIRHRVSRQNSRFSLSFCLSQNFLPSRTSMIPDLASMAPRSGSYDN